MSKKKSKFVVWYEKPENKEALNKKRRIRYKTDKNYRKKVLANTKKWQQEQAKVRKSLPAAPKTSFSIGEAAKIIGCEQKTIRNFEKGGLIPVHADSSRHRRFSKKQIALIGALVTYRKETHYRDPNYAETIGKLSHNIFKGW